MLRTIEGVYRNGNVELTEVPSDVREEMRVLVTFLEPQSIDIRARGIDEAHAVEFRSLVHIRRGLGQPRMTSPMSLRSQLAGRPTLGPAVTLA